MAKKADFDSRVAVIVESTRTAAQAAVDAGNLTEAKRVLAAGIRQLREHKAALTAAEREVRDQYREAKLKNSQSGQTMALFVGSKGRGAIARGRAAEGRRLSSQRHKALAPYAEAKAHTDRAIASLDRVRADLTDVIARSREARSATAAAPKAAPENLPPAQWAPDPTGRNQQRWWDGSRWTHNVANAGTIGTDSI